MKLIRTLVVSICLVAVLLPGGAVAPVLGGAAPGVVGGADAPDESPLWRPVLPSSAAPAAGWEARFSPRGLSWDVYTVALDDQYVYFGGGFVAAGDVEAHYVARWDPAAQTWAALGEFHSAVRVLYAADDGYLYAGGENFVERWDPAAGTWENLGNPDHYVLALAKLGDYLYVGGSFTAVEGTAASRVARLHLPGRTWEPLGAGLDDRVLALEVSGDRVYAGGEFGQAGGAAANRIAAWDTVQQAWVDLAGGVQGGMQSAVVRALAADQGTLYVGGAFTQTGTVAAENVAAWNGVQWQALGEGIDGTVHGLSAGPAGLYAAGNLYASGTPPVEVDNAARWNPATQKWEPLDTGLDGDYIDLGLFPDGCTACGAAAGFGRVFFAGSFKSAGGRTALRAAAWDPAAGQWEALYNGPGGQGLDGDVNAVAVMGSDVYVGGWFEHAGADEITYLAKWDSLALTWSPLLSGPAQSGVDWGVYALAVLGDDLYVGGRFGQAGGIDVHYLARWNSTTESWHAVGSGSDPGPIDWVEALAVQGDKLFVGGYFTGVIDYDVTIPTDYFAVWDAATQSWSTVADAGLGGRVQAILPAGDDVYVGGGFYQAGGSRFSHIARLDTLTGEWHAVGEGLDGTVNDLVLYDGDVLAAGVFTPGVKRWNTSAQAWELLPGGGFSGGFYYGSIVYDLEVSPNGDIFAGGTFDHSGTTVVYNIARWSPACERWLPVDIGTNAAVHALALQDDRLYAGGVFSLAGRRPSARFAAVQPGEAVCGYELYMPVHAR